MKNLTFVFAFLLILGGCANLLNIRKDINEEAVPYEPTIGGAWPEGNVLESQGRDLAQEGAEGAGYREPESWLASDRQDLYRKGLAYSQNPNLEPKVKRLYGDSAQRTTRDDFVDKVQAEGSLWAPQGQTNFFFTENRIKNPGDIINIQVEDAMVKDIAAEMKRGLNDREIEGEIQAAQARNFAKANGLPEPGSEKAGGSQAAPRAPAAAKKGTEKVKEVEVPEATYADIDLTKSMGIKAGETMMGEIVERYPNGNDKIRATKKVNYPTGPRLLTMFAVAKGPDVEKKDIIASGGLYEYRLQVNR
jgi:flagellar basal body L-ring protein FlgH